MSNVSKALTLKLMAAVLKLLLTLNLLWTLK